MRTEVRRGRKFVEYHDPDTQPEGTFTQEIGAHDVSYLDTDGKWKEVDENWLTDRTDGYIVKADKLNHKVRLKSNGGRAWYPRRNVDTEFLAFGIPQYYTGSKWNNFGFSGWSVSGKTITLKTRQNVTILVHSLWSGIKIDWVLANASAPKRMRYPVTLTGITESAGVLFGADSVELGRLTPTTATDANGLELACTGAYSGGNVEFSADVTGAVYPVTIDPDFAAGASYGFVYGRNTTYTTARSTAYGSYTNDLRVGQTPGYYVYRSFVQFDTSSITSSNTIAQVNLRLAATTDNSLTDFDVQIVKYDWSGQSPLASGNREAAYDGCLAADADSSVWRNTNGMSVYTQYTSGNLATDWVNRTGTTYYGLRSSLDANNTTPTQPELIFLAAPTHATAPLRPTLIVTYASSSQNLTLDCAAGSYSLTGTAATLSVKRNYTLACSAGSYALTGTDATLTVQRNYALACASGSYSLTGADTSFVIQRHYTLSCAAGSYAQTGTDATLAITRFYSLACASGSYGLTGTDTAFEVKRNYTLACDAGSYSLAGSDCTLTVTRHYVLACESGSFSLTGANVTLTVHRNHTLTCDSGAYTLTGADATLTVTRNYTLSLDAGAYSLTGADATLTVTRHYVLACEAGSYALTGSQASLTSGRTLACETGSYALTGADISFGTTRNYTLTCEAGTYQLTGSDAGVNVGYVLVMDAGSYTLTGKACGLFILTPTPAIRIYIIAAENRTRVVNAEARLSTIPAEARTNAIAAESREHIIAHEDRTLEVQ